VQVAALLRQPVLVALGALLVEHPVEDPLLDEAVEALGQHIAGDTEARLELVEAAPAEEGVADDQERPALADDLQGAGDRAVLAVVVAPEHASRLAQSVASRISILLRSVLSKNLLGRRSEVDHRIDRRTAGRPHRRAGGAAAPDPAARRRLRAVRRRDRARAVCIRDAVPALPPLRGPLALRTAGADADLRDVRLRRARFAAPRGPALRRRRPAAGPARR